MREIVSPLSGIRSPISRADPYKAAGFRPVLVADMTRDYYRNTSRKSFDDLFTHSRLGNATMVDSDGLLKWGPHNLLTYSEDFSNAAWIKQTGTTVTANQAIAPDGLQTADLVQGNGSNGILVSSISVPATGQNTKAIWIKGVSGGETVKLKDPVLTIGTTTCSLTTEWQLFELSEVQTGGQAGLWVDDIPSGGIYIWGAHLYRSDLGGMAPVPPDARVAGSTTYVPTTSTAKYLPRRHNHIYNGSAWVDAGTLIETEARTNLITYSEDFTDASWPKSDVTVSSSDSIDPSGGTGACELIESATTANHLLNKAGLVASTSSSHTNSIYAKANTRNWIRVQNQAPSSSWVNVNLTTGQAGLSGGGEDNYSITNVGNGWVRISLTSTPTAAGVGPQIFIIDSDRGGASPSYLGDGTSSILIYGAQFEEASTPSSYIPTSGSTVTRAADTSGLTIDSSIVPWPTPKVIGDELWNTPTISDPAVWSWDGETLVGTGDGTSDTARGDAVTAGSLYQVSFTVGASGSGLFQVRIGNTFIATLTGGANQTYTYLKVAADTTGLTFTDTGSTTATVTNISVKEINPLAVCIQMKGRATGDSYTTLRWYADANNYITQEIGTSDFTFEQAASGTVDSVTGGSITSGVNVPFNVASYHGSIFVGGAVGGAALTANETPVALADMSSNDISVGYDFMGNVEKVRIWVSGVTSVTTGDALAEGATA